jgi:hypothetical protein
MSTRWFARTALAVGVAAVAIVAGAGSAAAAQPGDPCGRLHETATDDGGRVMWCNPTMTGEHSLVWQYGGPA